MKLKIFYIGVHKNFESEDLVWNILRKIHPCEFVEDISNADIVIRGVYSDGMVRRNVLHRALTSLGQNLGLKKRVLIQTVRDIYDPQRNQVWIHVSGESPNNTAFGSFLNSECDFGFGHESINHENYIRMPQWYQSIDWAQMGFSRQDAAFYRLGNPIDISELTSGIPVSEFKKKNNRCALVSSHLSSPRDVFVKEVEKILPVDIYGLTGSGPVQYRSNLCKRDLLKDYFVVLAPENRLHPGYITEKVPEAFACGAFPVGWYLAGLIDDFSAKSHLNAANLGASALSGNGVFSDILSHELGRVKSGGLPPLLENPPTLDPIIELIERAITMAKVN